MAELKPEAVYYGLWRFLGTEDMVAMRRNVIDLRNEIENEVRRDGYRQMFNGSRREGFRLRTSDFDVMYWPTDHKLIGKLSQATHYKTTKHTLILMESEYSPPGYVLLRLLSDSSRPDVSSACINMNGKLYISSSLRPCVKEVAGFFEIEETYGFKSDFWLVQAFPWVLRCFKKPWPSITTLCNIVKNGCHVVAIGHKSSSYEVFEWRISFSQAEHYLIYSLSHCHFLCYGLLKLFLKEVINKEEKFLSSYHMKTILFWVIQNNYTLLDRQNVIECFWTCFKTLCYFVNHGVCPNFFIPENNLFLVKIHGNSQSNLFHHLMEMHSKGPLCLLMSKSISDFLQEASLIPDRSLQSDVILPNAVFDKEFFTELLYATIYQFTDHNTSIRLLETLENLLRKKSTLKEYQKPFLQVFLSESLQYNAFKIKACFRDGCNRIKYKNDKISRHLLEMAEKSGFLSASLYVALFHYTTHKYKEAVGVLEGLKSKMSQPSLLYKNTVNMEAYEEAVKELSLSKRIRKHAVTDLKIGNNFFYIKELMLEQEISLKNGRVGLLIPPFVMLHFLLVLCYRQLDPKKVQSALDDLHVLVHYDENRHIPEEQRDISWQILGICQQMTRHFKDAECSYKKVSKQNPLDRIKEAAEIQSEQCLLLQKMTRSNSKELPEYLINFLGFG